LLKEIDTGLASPQGASISDDPSSKDLSPEGGSAGHLPYGIDTIVIPFTWSGLQRRRLPWRRFGGYKRVTGPCPPDHVGQSGVEADQQLATALKDVRQTSTDLALSALHPQGNRVNG